MPSSGQVFADDAERDVSSSSEDDDNQGSYEVERILDEDRSSEHGILYLVKWAGYPDYRSTWEPLQNFDTKG